MPVDIYVTFDYNGTDDTRVLFSEHYKKQARIYHLDCLADTIAILKNTYETLLAEPEDETP